MPGFSDTCQGPSLTRASWTAVNHVATESEHARMGLGSIDAVLYTGQDQLPVWFPLPCRRQAWPERCGRGAKKIWQCAAGAASNRKCDA